MLAEEQFFPLHSLTSGVNREPSDLTLREIKRKLESRPRQKQDRNGLSNVFSFQDKNFLVGQKEYSVSSLYITESK